MGRLRLLTGHGSWIDRRAGSTTRRSSFPSDREQWRAALRTETSPAGTAVGQRDRLGVRDDHLLTADASPARLGVQLVSVRIIHAVEDMRDPTRTPSSSSIEGRGKPANGSACGQSNVRTRARDSALASMHLNRRLCGCQLLRMPLGVAHSAMVMITAATVGTALRLVAFVPGTRDRRGPCGCFGGSAIVGVAARPVANPIVRQRQCLRRGDRPA